MARSHSSASFRSNHHVPDINLTALQGATTTFNASSCTDAAPQNTRNRAQIMGTAVFPDTSHGHYDTPPSHPPSDTDSNLPPEVGSVRDKIGRFAATYASSPSVQSQNGHESYRRDVKFPARPHTPQQIAARLAAERSPVRDENPAAAPRGLVQAQNKPPISTPPSNNNKWTIGGQDSEMPAPKAIRSPAAPSPALQKLLREDHREPPPLPRKPPVIPRKPVTQSPTSPNTPSLAQLAAARSSPSPSSSSSISRKPPPVPSRSSTFPTSATATTQSNNASSRPISPFSDEKKPALPPRPRPNGFSKTQTHSGILMEDLEPSKQSMTPSLASLSTTSHNNSSTSTLDRTNGVDEESLSNAIVASSIASARAPSPKPTKIPPTPPKPRRRSRSRSILSLGHRHTHSHDHNARHSSPPKGGLRQTLRDTPKPEIPHLHHHHHRLPIHRHPHKHHEGDRKRWQSSVTEQERKRYEGVWAANKGLLIPIPPLPSPPSSLYYEDAMNKYPPNAPEMVLNLVVRDIWSRSRLAPLSLEHVWNLVDRQKTGLLDREEFVVGMWLIDQQLKGHKLPVKVPDSVWDSVRRISGVKAPSLV